MRLAPLFVLAAVSATPAIGGPLAYAACQTGKYQDSSAVPWKV